MRSLPPRPDADPAALKGGWAGLCRLGGVTALLQLACSVVTMAVILSLGGEPTTAGEAYDLLTNDRLTGLLRLDFASMLSMALFYVTFFGLYAALRHRNAAYATLATALAFVGLTLWLSVHSAFSMVHLADRYAAATSEAERTILLAAGEGVLASNMWHSSAAVIAGIFVLGAAVLISVVMLGSGRFSRWTAWTGIVAWSVDLTRVAINVFVPGSPGDVLMAVAGPLYPVWFVLLGRDLLRASRPGELLAA